MTEPQGPPGYFPPAQQGPWSPPPPPGQPSSPPPGAGPWQVPQAGAVPPPGVPGAPPPGWPAQPEKKSHTLRNVLIAVGVVVVLGVAAVVVGVVFFVKVVTGPADATNEYLAALKANKTSAAYGHLCDSLQDDIGPEQFARIIAQEKDRNGAIVSYNVHSTEITNGRGHTEYSLKRRSGTTEIEANLVKEDGEWKLCSFSG